MSEPTLILAYDNLRTEIAFALGWTRTESKWTAAQVAVIDKVLQSGYRRFLFPAVLPNDTVPHKWSFLEPTDTIVAFAAASGTVSGLPVYATPSSTITATAAKFFPGMVGRSITFDTSSTSYVIVGYTSSTIITVTGNASGELTGDTFTIDSTGDVAMPDNFGSMSSEFYLSSSVSSCKTIQRRGLSDILRRRAEDEDRTGAPEFYAIAPKAHTGAAGQRQQAMFWPTPDDDYTLTFQYQLLRNKIDATYVYPAGIESHSETILAAILAECDHQMRQDFGNEARFKEMLFTSVKMDEMNSSPESMGYNSNRGAGVVARHNGENPAITYNGGSI